MDEPIFGFSYYQLIALILSNVFPNELCILIARFLKLSEFELSRKEYLIDYRSYKGELRRYVTHFWRGRFDNSLSNLSRNTIRYRPTCDFLKVRGSILSTIRLHKDFSLKPYYNTFGKKYEKVTRKIKVMARGYQKYRRVNETLVNYMIRVAKEKYEPTPYIYHGNNHVIFNFNNIMNTFQNMFQDTPDMLCDMVSARKRVAGRYTQTKNLEMEKLHFHENTKKRVKKDFRLNRKQNKKYQNTNFKRSRVSYKNSCR